MTDLSQESPSRLAKEMAWTLIAQGGRVALQGVSFVLLARALGAVGLGVFSGTTALISVLVPFCGWGSANLIQKYVSRDRRNYPAYVGNAMVIGAVSGLVMALLAALVAPVCLGNAFAWGTFVLLVISEMFVLRVVDVATQAFPAVDRQDLCARAHLLHGVCRLGATLLFIVLPFRSSVTLFCAFYLAGTMVAAGGCLRMLSSHFRDLGAPRFSRAILILGFKEGFPFSFGISSKSIYSDIDKTMLARMISPDVNGVYTAAYRIIGMVFIPLQAAVLSNGPRLFRKGAAGVLPAARHALLLLPVVLFLGCLTGGVLWAAAPILPGFLGPAFARAVPMLRWLAWMPLVQGVHYLLGDVLMGMDRQGLRSTCQAGVAVLNVILNFWLIPTMSWKGAVLATYGAEGALAVAMVVLVAGYSARAVRDARPAHRAPCPCPLSSTLVGG